LEKLRAMVLDAAKSPLREDVRKEEPKLGPHDVLIRVAACGVCRTDLHIVDGELTRPKLPLVLGHEIVGTITAVGSEVAQAREGDRVGVPWLGWTDGECKFCRSGRENLCDHAKFTGYDVDGGYAEFVAADERFIFPIPAGYGDAEATPLLCAGLIGFRALRMAGNAERIGFYGFGVSADMTVQAARYRGQKVYAFTRPSDTRGQEFARSLGAVWAGGSDESPPEPLDAALIFAPVGALVPTALAAVTKGGSVVCAGIHMTDIPRFPYEILWEERILRSVANLTRQDGREFFALVEKAHLKTFITRFPLSQANEALNQFRAGRLEGAAVLSPTG
jgi:alcohol dehydrogenase, propanol-preferring